jgi:hypothetical protein
MALEIILDKQKRLPSFHCTQDRLWKSPLPDLEWIARCASPGLAP